MKNLLFVVCAAMMCFSSFAQPGASSQNINLLRQSYRLAKTDTAKLTALLEISNNYYDANDFDNALIYTGYAKLICAKLKRTGDAKLMPAALNGEGECYAQEGDVSFKKGNFILANAYYTYALNSFTEIKNRYKMARTYSNIASNFSAMGKYSESLEYSFKSLKIDEALKDERAISVELNNIGAIYTDLKNSSKALEYHQRALQLGQKLGNKSSIALYTGNIGSIYQRMCDSADAAGNTALSLALQEKALYYYNKALTIAQEIQDKDGEAVWLENIGIVYSNVYQYKKALRYLLQAFDLYKELRLKAEQSYCAQNVGIAYQGLKQYKKAEEFLQQSIQLAEETRSLHYIMEASLSNSTFYGQTNRPAQALAFYKQYIANRDSMFNSENTNAFARTELNYEFEKKQAAIKFENDKIIYKLEADNKLNKQLRLFLLLVIVLATVLLFFAKRAYDNKKRVAAFLDEEGKRKEVLLQEVHHRINNNLQIISSLLSLQANSAQNDKLYEYLTQSQNRIQSLAVMHDLLYQTDSPLQINMHDYLNKIMEYHREILSTIPAKVNVDMDIENVEFQTKTAVPLALIVNELVTNAIKYAFKDSATGALRISLKRFNNNWKLTVSDSGKGIPEGAVPRKDSLGLRLITIMSKQMNATLTKSNAPGATFEIVFNV